MSEKRILHISAKNATPEELETIRDIACDSFSEREVIVTDDSVDVFEMPTAEEFVDEITERIVEESRKPNFSERL
jgi:hypothetical protein